MEGLGGIVLAQLYDSSGYRFARNDDLGNGYGKLKASRTRASRIDVENPRAFFDEGLVGVARHNNLNACCPWLYIELSKIVDCIDEDFANLNEFCFGQLLCPGTSIVVPSNSCDWGY